MTHILKMAAAAVVLSTAAASAQNVSAVDPMNVMRVMQENGYLATMGTDSQGDPKISSKVSESNFSVFFYGCNNGTRCSTIQFSSGYDLNNAISTSRINEWNRENRFGRAFVDDEGDPFIRMDVVIKGEGMSRETFDYQMNFWRLLIEEFEDFIDW